jgi:hypothetical protein
VKYKGKERRRDCRVAQEVKPLPSKHESLNSNPSTAKKKKKRTQDYPQVSGESETELVSVFQRNRTNRIYRCIRGNLS